MIRERSRRCQALLEGTGGAQNRSALPTRSSTGARSANHCSSSRWVVRASKIARLAHYAQLGCCDFLDIYEAPDEEAAAKISLIRLSNSAFQAESWLAIPQKRFVELTEQV